MNAIDSAETIPPSDCGLGQVSAPSVCEAAALIDAINELHSRLYTAQVKARLYTAQVCWVKARPARGSTAGSCAV
jgi:hypothetical protein